MFKKDKSTRKKTGLIIIKKYIIILSIIIYISLSITSANAYERPEFTDGLGSNWHKAKICLPCHYMLLGTEKARTISNSCMNCHQYHIKGYTVTTDKKLDMKSIENIHLDIVCIRCHVGSQSQKNLTAADFHRVMKKTACLVCHTYENGTYKKPLKNKCSDCHSGSPHVVHGKRIEELCAACHGEFGEQYATKSIKPGDEMIPSSLSNLSGPDKYEYQTIGQLIIKLLEQIMQIRR